VRFQNAAYLDGMVTSLGQGQEEEGEELSPIIAALKKSLLTSGAGSVTDTAELRRNVEKAGEARLSETLSRLHEGAAGSSSKGLKEILAEAKASRLSGKALDINILKTAFEVDAAKKPAAGRQAWTGNNFQVLGWHYEKSLGRWFNMPERNGALAARVNLIAHGLFWVLLAGMGAMLFAARNNGLLHWALIAIPILLPAFFIAEYAAWLWWYGHTLNEMGAFTLKPFMPTVFGQGKVAQFSTHSYPHRGFGLMLLTSAVLVLALLIRRKQLQEEAPVC
jgi:hypothetical protein